MPFYVPNDHPAHWASAKYHLVRDKAFLRECDAVFTTLTPRILVDVPKTDREFASDPDRLGSSPTTRRSGYGCSSWHGRCAMLEILFLA